jgi:nicotinamidase-related amidase
MRVSDAMALVTIDVGGSPCTATLSGLAAAFRTARLPLVHVVDTTLAAGATPASTSALDLELLERGGVETLGPAELAIALRAPSAFDGTPLDALLRGLGVDTIVIGGPVRSPPSPRVSASVSAAELRGYRVLLATDELAVTLGAYLTAA